jgi:membrane-associated phospholipid phosphatase
VNEKPRPFLAWPGWPLLAETALLGTGQTLWWLFVYWGCDWLTGLRTGRRHVHFDFELSLPFEPALVLVYRSIDPMFLLGPFILRSRREIYALWLALFIAIGIAGICFLLLPAELAYPAHADAGFWEPLLEWNRQIVRTYNLLPSLHVALSVITLAAYATHCHRLGKTLLALWAAAIALSTLFLHQHHVLDVVTGLALGWACWHWVYRRTTRPSPSSDPVPPA